MTGLLFTGGEGPERRYIAHILRRHPRIIAADSGIDLARKMGITPDLIVGDMDSVSDVNVLEEYPTDTVIRHPADKDETDTELGVRYLREYGCTEIVVAGGGGGRLDHLIGMLSLFERDFSPAEWYTGNEQVILIRDSLSLECRIGELISFFPVGRETATMSSSGLKWPLDRLAWNRGDTGISNRAADHTVTVTMRSGRLILIREIREETTS